MALFCISEIELIKVELGEFSPSFSLSFREGKNLFSQERVKTGDPESPGEGLRI